MHSRINTELDCKFSNLILRRVNSRVAIRQSSITIAKMAPGRGRPVRSTMKKAGGAKKKIKREANNKYFHNTLKLATNYTKHAVSYYFT